MIPWQPRGGGFGIHGPDIDEDLSTQGSLEGAPAPHRPEPAKPYFSVESLQQQLDYALRLVARTWIARRCSVQIELIDVWIDTGALPGETITHDALINGNLAAADHLV